MERHRFRASAKWFHKLKPLARQMRHAPTQAENRLWQQLRDRKIASPADGVRVKFRRQAVIERFVVDFYAARAWIVVEVDGTYHQYTPEEDLIRQEFLESLGLKVLRVTNDQVMSNLEGVAAWIAQNMREE